MTRSTGLGVYIADVTDGNYEHRSTRYVVLAIDAEEAAEYAAGQQWPSVTREALAALAEDRVRVGRLGDYAPGIDGAAMTGGAAIVVRERR